jgi:hypothetical protein
LSVSKGHFEATVSNAGLDLMVALMEQDAHVPGNGVAEGTEQALAIKLLKFDLSADGKNSKIKVTGGIKEYLVGYIINMFREKNSQDDRR